MSSVDTRSGATSGLRRRGVLAGLRSSPSDHPSGTCRDAGREKEAVDHFAPCIIKRVLRLVVPEANTLAHALWLTWDPQRSRSPPSPPPPRRRPPCPAPPCAAGVSSPASSSSFRRRPGSRLSDGASLSENAALRSRSRPHHLRVSPAGRYKC